MNLGVGVGAVKMEESEERNEGGDTREGGRKMKEAAAVY